MKALLHKSIVFSPKFLLLVRKNLQDGPRLNGGVGVAKFPFVSGKRAIWMLKLVKEEEPELVLGKFNIDKRIGERMKSEIPGSKPGILPFIGHRKNAHRKEVAPMDVPNCLVPLRRGGAYISLEPIPYIEQIGLLIPNEPSKSSPLDDFLLFRC